MKNHALNVFRCPPERLNCAQAVLHAYMEVSGNKVMDIADMKPYGGGKAPDGLCGALYAACTCSPKKADGMKEKFAQKLGSTKCRELKAIPNNRCEDSVSFAAELLQAE